MSKPVGAVSIDGTSLVKVNMEFATSSDAGDRTAAKLRSVMCNPIYAGTGPFSALLDDGIWLRATAQMIEQEGAEQFLVNMRYVLRQSFGADLRGSKGNYETRLNMPNAAQATSNNYRTMREYEAFLGRMA